MLFHTARHFTHLSFVSVSLGVMVCVLSHMPVQAASQERGAQSATVGQGPARQVKRKAGSKGKQRLTSMKVIRSSSEETAAQRTRRLKRECKGLPNAGACLGMTD